MRFLCVAAVVFSFHPLLQAQNPAPAVIPSPRIVVPTPGAFRFTSATRIVLGTRTTPADREAVISLNEALVELSLATLKDVREEKLRLLGDNVVYIGHPESKPGRAVLAASNLAFTEPMTDEGYVLSVQRGQIAVIGATPRGRYYGVMTLLQLLQKEKRAVHVAPQSIQDWPRQTLRGITDDISRGQVSTLDDFKRIIRFLSRHKLNVYSPYMEDMFVFSRHPSIGSGRGALAAHEIRDLDAYAKRFHVELIPTFETLGHWENILILPEYRDLAEFPGAHTVNISDERVLTILDEMVGEIARSFSSPWFNVAADESWDVGLGANKSRVAASDLATVHAEHYRRVFDILARYGKRPMMYGDIILNNPGILEKIPKEVVVIDWQYWAGEAYASTEVFRTAGFPFVVSPAVYNFAGPFPNYLHTFVNIRNFNREGFRRGSKGLLTSNWNDYGGEALREFNFYGYAWTAECAWNPEEADLDRFNTAYFRNFFGTEEAARAAQTVYTLLSSPANLVGWHELWRHPMLPLRQSTLSPLWRIQSIRTATPLLRSLLADIRATGRRNQDHVSYLEFIVNLNSWFADKLQAGERVRLLTQNPPPGSSPDSIRLAVLQSTSTILPSLQDLKREFRRLWLKTNKVEGLELLERRYGRQEAYWKEKLDQVQKGELWMDPNTPSQWIYHPKASPQKRDSLTPQVPRAAFRTEFIVPDSVVVTRAVVQLIGDTYATLRLNGEAIGEVLARRSLSLTVEEQRVKSWDITAQVAKGKNRIDVEAANYGMYASAGANIYARIQGTGGFVLTPHSDSTWTASDAAHPESGWLPAKVVPPPTPVIAPNPDSGRRSWIER